VTKFFKTKGKQTKAIPVPQPREMVAIEAEYNDMRGRAADSQYQIYVHTKALEEFNNRMLNLNQEGAARKELDAKTAAEAAKETQDGK